MEIAKPGSTTGLFDPTMVDKLIQVERMPIESAEKRRIRTAAERKRQQKQRQKEQPERAQFDTEEVFRLVTGYFEPPDEAEDFNLMVVER